MLPGLLFQQETMRLYSVLSIQASILTTKACGQELDVSMHWKIGRRRFNESPKAGLAYLREHNVFSEGGSVAEVARFLFDEVRHCPGNGQTVQPSLNVLTQNVC